MNITNQNSLYFNVKTAFIKLTNFFYLISCLTLQFYVFASGSIQPSHFSLLLSFIFSIIFLRFNLKILSSKSLFYFILFVFITILINLTFTIFYNSDEFLIASSYYLFGLIYAYITILLLNKSLYLKQKLINILLYSLIVLIFLWAIGYGEYKFFPRYNGFFNDPNQMSHWALCIVASIIILNSDNKRLNILAFLLGSIIVLISLSRSGFVGLALIGIGIFLKMKKTIITIIILISIIAFSSISSKNDFAILSSYENLANRLLETNIEEQADTRGYTRLLNYPEYLLFGSGQGLDYRFNSDYEIHSSWVGILFYYGIFTTILFLYALYLILNKLELKNRIIALGPLLYGFSTFGIRTPVFWLFIGVIIYITYYQKKDNYLHF